MAILLLTALESTQDDWMQSQAILFNSQMAIYGLCSMLLLYGYYKEHSGCTQTALSLLLIRSMLVFLVAFKTLQQGSKF